uniref:Signal peptidase I n=1 Tax=Rhodobacter capsulatus TaxID=1061 RepID=Q52697_RHOCA|nr:leader peptidase [Rhodobacter capsulatus]
MASKSEGGIGEMARTLFWALIIAGVFRTLFFQPFWIPSGSMKDTLLIGDFLFVNKMAYGYSRYSCPFSSADFSPCPIEGRILGGEPERGDVVVFRHPIRNVDFIKRLIGLPGDRIQMVNGVLQINGAPVKLEDGGTFSEVFEPQAQKSAIRCAATNPWARAVIASRSASSKRCRTAVSHSILNTFDGTRADNTPVFVVPEGQYFFMGDNRDNSEDSRFAQSIGGVGFVPAENLVGRRRPGDVLLGGEIALLLLDLAGGPFFKAIE